MHTSKIEINQNEKLNSIYFPTSPECKCLSAVTIKKFNYNVDRSTNQSKIQGLVDISEEIIDEISINFRHSKWCIHISDKTITIMRDISTLLAFLINILYIIDANRYDDFKEINVDTWSHILSYIIGAF